MAQPKRSAQRRTPEAITEDLKHARKAGGLWRADESHLASTIDFLVSVGVSSEETPLARARDLLLSHVRRSCELYESANTQDLTAKAAGASLRELLTRPANDDRLVESIRRKSIPPAHPISSDAIRHREDSLIDEIAGSVFAELEVRRLDEPQTMEAAIHGLAPLVADLRQQLHDGLCLTYQHIPAAQPREARVVEGYYRQVIIKLADLLVACDRILELGITGSKLSKDDFFFMRRAAQIGHYLFDEQDDRVFMREFIKARESRFWEENVAQLLATDQGEQVFERWVEWANACYPTCAFERTVVEDYMCEPHQLVTLLYDTEVEYVALGYSELVVEGNLPMLHHGLPRPNREQ